MVCIGNEEGLLLEAQLAALGGVVGRVEHLGDGLDQGTLLDRAAVVADLRERDAEVVRGNVPRGRGNVLSPSRCWSR